MFVLLVLVTTLLECEVQAAAPAMGGMGMTGQVQSYQRVSDSIQVDDPAILPGVDVNLAPPRRPYPLLAKQIQVLEDKRKAIEKWQLNNLTLVYAEEMEKAPARIRAVIKQALEPFDDPRGLHAPKVSSFIYTGEFRIEVPTQQTQISPKVNEKVTLIDQYRQGYANISHDESVKLLRNVTDTVVRSLNTSLFNQLRPLMGLKQQALLQLQAITSVNDRCEELKISHKVNCTTRSHPSFGEEPSSFIQVPMESSSLAKLVEDMQSRRDTAEDLLTQQGLNTAMKLALEEANLVEYYLGTSVAYILDTYRDVIKKIVRQRKNR